MAVCHQTTSQKLHKQRPKSTVYPKKYAHGFVVLCFVVVMQSFIMNSHEVYIHIHQGCFAGTGAIVWLPQCQWSKPDGYGKISQCITTTKHSNAKNVCIFLGIYCITIWLHYTTACWSGCKSVSQEGDFEIKASDDNTLLYMHVIHTRGLTVQISASHQADIEGILPKAPYLPCVSMAGRTLLAVYHRYVEQPLKYTISLFTSGPLFTKREDVLLQDLAKFRSREIRV